MLEHQDRGGVPRGQGLGQLRDVLVGDQALGVVQDLEQRCGVVRFTELGELGEGGLALVVLAHRQAVDDGDGPRLHEPAQLGHHPAGELAPGELDHEQFDGPMPASLLSAPS